MQTESDDVRQSAFAFLGDMAITVFPMIKPFLSQIMQLIIKEIRPEPTADLVCNNAIWSLGEISLQLGPEMSPWFSFCLRKRVIPVLCTSKPRTSLAENAAITLGRLELLCLMPFLRTSNPLLNTGARLYAT